MMRPFVAYVPNSLWTKLGTEIDHFEYDSPQKGISVAVYADGHQEEFDSRVTLEREAEYNKEQLEILRNMPEYRVLFSGEIKVASPKFHRQLIGVTGA